MDEKHCQPPRHEMVEAMGEIYQLENMQAFMLFRRLKATTHLLDVLRGEYRSDSILSGARMRLLVHLTVNDRLGRTEGVLPSELSAHLGVSRNTISTLLNGLEEQGLIERHLHPTDRRQILIRITSAGKLVVHERAPEFGRYLAELFSALSDEEQRQLSELLDKLFSSFVERAAAMGIELPGKPERETSEENNE